MIDDLRQLTENDYLKRCGGDPVRGKMWFTENEKRRAGVIKRLRAERRKLIKEHHKEHHVSTTKAQILEFPLYNDCI